MQNKINANKNKQINVNKINAKWIKDINIR